MDPTPYPPPLEALRSRCEVRDYSKGDTVFRLGDAARAVYYLLDGEVHLLRNGPDGGTVILHRALPRGFFAEASLNAERYHCTALCVRASRVLVLPRNVLRRQLEQDSDFALDWVSGLCTELRRQRSTVERLQLRGAEARVRHYLLTEGDAAGGLELRCTVSHWADLLGLTRETLYRTLARMEARGDLDRAGKRLQLTNGSQSV
jgi:CRP/FNR family transcriptional regulator, dissimilatory nitrate respiration regulator